MPVSACMRETTYKQFQEWQYYLSNQWLDVPDRQDMYLMKLACVVRQILVGKEASKIKPIHFYVKGSEFFGSLTPQKFVPLRLASNGGKNLEQLAEERVLFKAVWGARIKAGESN